MSVTSDPERTRPAASASQPLATAAATGLEATARAVDAIVVAAGRGRRFGGGDNKVLTPLDGQPIWRWSVEALRRCGAIDRIVLVIRPEDREAFRAVAESLELHLVNGGQERFDSVRAGLEEVARSAAAAGQDPASRWVAVHDAARPLVPQADLDAVINAAVNSGAAILATPVRGTLKRKRRDGDTLMQTVDRSDLWEALTPQVFRLDHLQAAYQRWRGRPVTDDAEMVERSGFPVTLVPGSAENLKITQAEDLLLAEAILSRRTAPPLATPR